MSEAPKSVVQDYEAIHRRVVDRIVADLSPVRRLWPVGLRLGVWIALEASMLLFVVHATHRTDLRQQVGNLWYLSGIAGFAMVATIGAGFALRSAIPGREPGSIEIVLLFAVAAASALLLLREPLNGNVSVTRFIEVGVRCAVGVFTLAALPWFALAWAIRRGAPLSPAPSGALLGAAAFFCSFALMRIFCPIDEGLHLVAWHLLPTLAGVALSTWAGLALFRRPVNR